MSDLDKFNIPVPRYTSYPTAPNWSALSPEIYETKLEELKDEPLSLYFHIPFCASMCLFCGCSVVLNRKEENEIEYVNFLCKEMELVFSKLKKRKKVTQLHFGGGTPTKLSEELLRKIFEKIQECFEIDPEGEIAIEIDPRTVFHDGGKKLKFLRDLGFNRVSFGVQDMDEKVQEAIKRHQSEEMTRQTFRFAKALHFDEINLDLIYGLPLQTRESFRKTVTSILTLLPDRIALFSYAKVPWLKPHQRAIREESLPTTEEKFQIYSEAREAFIESGYVAIGMDHFALPTSELAKSYLTQTLHRNFQGYTVKRAETFLSFGITAIGFLQNTYVQNVKELKTYYSLLSQNQLPTHRGKILTADDIIRKWVIEQIMCQFCVDKKEFREKFGVTFDLYFGEISDDFLINTEEKLFVKKAGELFVRNMASHFDAYFTPTLTNQFSKMI